MARSKQNGASHAVVAKQDAEVDGAAARRTGGERRAGMDAAQVDNGGLTAP